MAANAGSSATGPQIDDVHESVGPASQTFQTPCPAKECLVEGLIDRGQIGVFAAKPGTGKTPFLTQLSSALAAGVPFFGLPTNRCRVGLIDVESNPADHRGLLERQWAAMNIDPALVGGSIDVFVNGNPNDPNSRELDRILTAINILRWNWLSKLAQQRQYGLIVVDTALAFSPFKASDDARVRELFSWVSQLRRTPPHPAVVLVVHLRKTDRKAGSPTLLQDPRSWCEEILGSVVWSASADVRLGLESTGQDEQVVFSGYRRGEGELMPRIIVPRMEDIDNRAVPVLWESVDPSMATSVLSVEQRRRFSTLPVGQPMTFTQMLNMTQAPKSSLHRLVRRACAVGLMHHDAVKGLFSRKV